MAKKPDSKDTATEAAPQYKWPKTNGGLADRLYTLRQARIELERQAGKMEEEEKALKKWIIDVFTRDGLTAAKGKFGSASTQEVEVPVYEDDVKFYAYLKRTGDFHLLQRRLNDTAIREMWAKKKVVPGIGSFKITKVSVNKA